MSLSTLAIIGLVVVVAILGGALAGVVWATRRAEPETLDETAVGDVPEPAGLDEPTHPDPPPRVDYLEEVLRDPPEPVPDDPDDPGADERLADRARAVLDEWDRLRGRLDE